MTSSSQLPDLKGSFIREYDNASSASEISFDNRVMLASKLSLFESRVAENMKPSLTAPMRNWAEVSKINYIASQHFEKLFSRHNYGKKNLAIPGVNSDHYLAQIKKVPEELDVTPTYFTSNVTPLLHEDHLWGCYYVFPELYDDEYSPVVRVKEPESVPPLVDGVLTKEMVAVCLSYLRRTPILNDFTLIKLDLSSKSLTNIDVLKNYKYLVYLDLGSNFLTDLSCLSFLPYLQHLNVSYNRLNQVLDYETPQWFLTEVHYKYNSVKQINDLTKFWSLVVLDLSHNNIKQITGLENLHYLRRLDLSFNHIQRFENINNLRIVWLDLSYNNISSYEFSSTTGLWTLLELEYLNINENNLGSLKLFVACNRLRELHARNNRFSTLLELTVYMRQLRKLLVLDLRANEVCTVSGYREVVITTFPILLSLDAEEIDPVQQRVSKMESEPDVMTFANRRLMRLLYVEQLSRAKLSHFLPEADTTEVPLVVLVGYEAAGKGKLARRLAKECDHVEQGILHTTAEYHFPENYIYVTRRQFDDMLIAGDILSYTEMYGQSYGLSREQGHVNSGKVKIVCLDLIGALTLSLRGLRPILILVSCHDKGAQMRRQQERREFQISLHQTTLDRKDKSTLQVMISGTILVTGIINELIQLATIPDDFIEDSKFVVESECSLFMDSQTRPTAYNYARAAMLNNLLQSRSSSMNVSNQKAKENDEPRIEQDNSVASLYNETAEDTNVSDLKIRDMIDKNKRGTKQNISAAVSSHSLTTKSFSRDNPPTNFKAYTKFSKSVTFTGPSSSSNPANLTNELDLSGLVIDPIDSDRAVKQFPKSISAKLESAPIARPKVTTSDNDLWLAFLAETGISTISEIGISNNATEVLKITDIRNEDPEFIFQQLGYYRRVPSAGRTMKIKDDYEDIHREHPGLFWDTFIMLDNCYSDIEYGDMVMCYAASGYVLAGARERCMDACIHPHSRVTAPGTILAVIKN